MIRLAVRVAREHAELVLAELLELAPGGVEEVDVGDAVVEYAVYGAPGELPALPALEAAAGGALVEVSTSEIADDWSERWREFHQPLVLDDRLCVRPPWASASQATVDVVIDPGQAFGTGAHATTRLCLELMLDRPSAPGAAGSFVDLGCGSGVLAIAAAKLGFAPVIALDNDPAAVQATIDNAERNGVRVRERALRDAIRPGARLRFFGGKRARRPIACLGRVPASAAAGADPQRPIARRGRRGRARVRRPRPARARAPDRRRVGGALPCPLSASPKWTTQEGRILSTGPMPMGSP